MATILDYMDNPHWRAMYFYAASQLPNNGFGLRCRSSNSPGQASLPVSSTNQHAIYMTRGHSQQFPYTGSVRDGDPQFKSKVRNCLATTGNIRYCTGCGDCTERCACSRH